MVGRESADQSRFRRWPVSDRTDMPKKAAEKLIKRAQVPGLPVDEAFDRENAFMLYANFCGDAERTAHALGVSAVEVLRMADDSAWTERLRAILALKRSTKPGDLERGLNRAMNFVQASRMRLFVGRLLKRFALMTDEELESYCLSSIEKMDKTVGGIVMERKINMKAFSDLAAAMEKCHLMSYAALNDTTGERTRRGEEAEREVSATEVHQAIADAMARVAEDKSPRAILFDEQIREGQQHVAVQQELKESQK